MVRRLTPPALGALVALVTLVCVPSAWAAWPSSGNDAIGDGDRVALLTPDRSAVEIYRNAQRSGRPVPLPHGSDMRPVGVFGSRVFLAGRASDAPIVTPLLDDRMAIADSASGQWHWLCGPPETIGPDGPACLRGTSSPGSIPRGSLSRVISAGRRWINVWWTFGFEGRALIKWSEKNGRFQARWSTERERDKVYTAVGKQNWIDGTPMTLSATHVGPVNSGGYARTVRRVTKPRLSYPASRVRVGLRRNGDRRSASMIVWRSSSSSTLTTSGVAFTSRGACVASRKQVAVWDKRTRRVWTLTINTSLAPADESFGPYVLCAGSSVLVLSRSAVRGYVPTITTLKWPSDRSMPDGARARRCGPERHGRSGRRPRRLHRRRTVEMAVLSSLRRRRTWPGGGALTGGWRPPGPVAFACARSSSRRPAPRTRSTGRSVGRIVRSR